MATQRQVVKGDHYKVESDQYVGVHRKMSEIMRQLDQKNGSPLDPNRLAAMLQRIVEGHLDYQTEYPVMLNFSGGLSSMLDIPRFKVDPEITENDFPIHQPPCARRVLRIVKFQHSKPCDEVVVEFRKQKKRFATVPEFLAFLRLYGEKKIKEFPIACLTPSTRIHPSAGPHMWACYGAGTYVLEKVTGDFGDDVAFLASA